MRVETGGCLVGVCLCDPVLCLGLILDWSWSGSKRDGMGLLLYLSWVSVDESGSCLGLQGMEGGCFCTCLGSVWVSGSRLGLQGMEWVCFCTCPGSV